LPKEVAGLVADAARDAAGDIELEPIETIHVQNDDKWYCPYWYLSGSYDFDAEIGIWIEVWVPDSTKWLDQGAAERPELLLGANGGSGPKGKARAKEFGTTARKALKSLPKGVLHRDEFDENNYYILSRPLSDILNADNLVQPGPMKSKLVEVLKGFTVAALPAMRAVRDHRKSRSK
jgi:hypothetical protein